MTAQLICCHFVSLLTTQYFLAQMTCMRLPGKKIYALGESPDISREYEANVSFEFTDGIPG